MLFTPANDFQWSADNFGASYLTTAFGTSVVTGAANTKGSDTEILGDATVTEDVYGIAICFGGPFGAGDVHQILCDIKIDPAGGTSYTTIIPNLICGGPAMLVGGYWYYFPLYMKAGTAIAAAAQDSFSTSNQQIRVGVRVFGKPSRPELCKVGSFVRAYGVTAASSNGTAITPGASQAMGGYTSSLATTADDIWWWQAGLAINDTTFNAAGYILDVAAGDATNKVLCAQHIPFSTTASEGMGKCPFGILPPFRYVKSGANVYARAACTGTADSSITVTAYGLGG